MLKWLKQKNRRSSEALRCVASVGKIKFPRSNFKHTIGQTTIFRRGRSATPFSTKLWYFLHFNRPWLMIIIVLLVCQTDNQIQRDPLIFMIYEKWDTRRWRNRIGSQMSILLYGNKIKKKNHYDDDDYWVFSSAECSAASFEFSPFRR